MSRRAILLSAAASPAATQALAAQACPSAAAITRGFQVRSGPGFAVHGMVTTTVMRVPRAPFRDP